MIKPIDDRIFWLGHDSFRIDSTKTIYIDPYKISSSKPADIILITHDHFDHCSPDDVKKIQTKDTIIVTEANCAKKLSGEIKILHPNEEITIAGIKISTVPAYNTNKEFHPLNYGGLGFIIETEETKIYHAGDTDLIPEMENIKADIALLPVSGTYVMTDEEAVNAALLIKPRLAIPMHFGAIVGSKENAEKFRDQLAGKISVRILEVTED